MTILISIVSFVVAISILVAIHEFGHFWVARRLGFKVLRYSIGFGRPLWKRIGKDGVEYVVAAIPLGGYVKMLDEREGPVEPHELPQSFMRRPVWQRLLVLAAGPAFNFIFAIVAYGILFSWGVPQSRPLIGEIKPDSYAAQAGLRNEDEILEVAGEPTPNTKTVTFALLETILDSGRAQLKVKSAQGEERQLQLRVDSAEERHRLTEPGALLQGLGFEFLPPPSYAVLGELTAGDAAERAGLKYGDKVLTVDGTALPNALAFIHYIRAHAGERIVLTVERDGARQDIPVEVRTNDTADDRTGRIGAAIMAEPRDVSLQRLNPVAAVGRATVETWEMSKLTVTMLWNMVIGKVSVKNISGPINIAAFAGETARVGLQPFLTFLAIVSISLGVLNLMPIPILDGGQMVYQLIELVKGSPLSERAQIFGQQIGIALLVILMSLAFYNDISSRFFN